MSKANIIFLKKLNFIEYFAAGLSNAAVDRLFV